jgi:hypothetical protein
LFNSNGKGQGKGKGRGAAAAMGRTPGTGRLAMPLRSVEQNKGNHAVALFARFAGARGCHRRVLGGSA